MAERFGDRCGSASTVPEIRPGTVKRYKKQDVQYTYHRPTGTRLPDLPNDHPDMIAAIRKAEENVRIQSDAADLWGGRVELPSAEHGLKSLNPPAWPEVVAFDVNQIICFVFRAKATDVVYYHHGNLHEDARRDPLVRQKGRYVALCVASGLLNPRQKRAFNNQTHYFATRTAIPATEPGLPRHALEGTISPDEYEALHAIDSRQASIATSRAIRDCLGITDAEASEMRNNFIRRGWLTNTRPP